MPRPTPPASPERHMTSPGRAPAAPAPVPPVRSASHQMAPNMGEGERELLGAIAGPSAASSFSSGSSTSTMTPSLAAHLATPSARPGRAAPSSPRASNGSLAGSIARTASPASFPSSGAARPESPLTGVAPAASASPRTPLGPHGGAHFSGAAVRRGGWRQSWATASSSASTGVRTRTASVASADREADEEGAADSQAAAAAAADLHQAFSDGPAHVCSSDFSETGRREVRRTSDATTSPSLTGLPSSQHSGASPRLGTAEILAAFPPEQDAPTCGGPEDGAEERLIWGGHFIQSVATPPGALAELPSSSGTMSPPAASESTAAPPWSSSAGAKSGDYDWANFVYAYARGRFDPLRLPWPPSQSTAYPGAETRIVDEPLVSPKSSPPPEGFDPNARRPSLTYIRASGANLHAMRDDGAHLRAASQAKDADAAAPGRSPADESMASWPGPKMFAGSRTPPPMMPSTAELKESASADPSRERQGSLPAQAPPRPTPSEAPSPPASLSGDAFAMLHFASSSSPQVREAASLGDAAQRILSDQASGRSPAPGAKSSPELSGNKLAKGSLARQASEGRKPAFDDSVWRTDETSGAGPRAAPSTGVPSTPRPDMHARISDLDLETAHVTVGSRSVPSATDPRGSSDSATSQPSSPVPSRNMLEAARRSTMRSSGHSSAASSASQVAQFKPLGEPSSVADSADTPSRPGPTPVQLPPELQQDGSEAPQTWSSAPEGMLTSFNSVLSSHLGGVRRKESDASAGDLGDTSTVSGLRRAARRASARRERPPVRPRTADRNLPPHSQSFHGIARTSFDEGDTLGPALDKWVPPITECRRPPQAIGRTISDGEGDEPPTAMRRTESHTYESMRNSCGHRVGQPSGNRSRTSSDAQWHRSSQDQEIITQPSAGTPSVNAYLTMGKRVEGFYREFGYLPAIVPPNDLERRQALRRYGPPKISSDVNFERVAHLVKLVFNTKLVIVSLVGEKTQHFRTQAGASSSGFSPEWLQSIAMSRNCSFCSHAILQDNDEPFVVLDTLKDWRFAGNPLVANSPHIRFYAGAPLRTTDGFNLGSLCIIDDKPWPEFNPRQRHTLREFARVVMREMELARDAIHLKSRDRMQHSIELFTRECLEMESGDASAEEDETGLHQVYAFAAKGMREALQASGAIVFDLSHFELVESPSFDGEEGSSKIFFPSPYQNPDAAPFASFDNPSGIEGLMETTGGMSHEAGAGLKDKAVPPMAVLGASESHAAPPDRGQPVPLSHYIKVADFLRRHRTGCYYPFVPAPFRHLLPAGTSNLLLVPIFGLNKQPFALLCAYSKSSENGPQLQDIKDSGLQYLRAMGTIILSAILKKDIMLADKAKSHFISNISHELRTPLHGILAAAELLAETKINATQGSYLETVEACGKSLLELVNHVLDFTKLSGNTRTSQVATKPTQRCDLVKLVQEVCESSWIGQMARKLDSQQSSGIGSAYAHGSGGATEAGVASTRPSIGRALGGGAVETVIDIMMRPSGWLVKCDAAGIRRVLMNLIGNSLKFTTEGFVHVSLREVQSSDKHVVVELGVTDTGKGISRAFLEEQLFHPFTQENHLGPGTGLGLSIVNSIVQSPAINGKIDVWSTLGQGTEMRVTCELELADASAADLEGLVYRPQLNVAQQHTVSLLGFNPESRGHSDLKEVLRSYLEDWWHCSVVDADADFVVINEALPLLEDLAKAARDAQATPPPALVLTGARGDPQGTAACDNYHKSGGVSRLLFKPVGPAKLETLVEFCIRCVERIKRGEPPLAADEDRDAPLPSPAASPMKPALEKTDSYFSTSSSSARTPRVEVRPDSALTPKASESSRVTVPSLHHAALSSHHMSPGPPSLADAGSLLRRHSDHDRNATVRTHSDTSVDSAPANSRRSRPTLPARSITFHEPRLQRQAVMSPNHLSHPHANSSRRGDSGEVHDYFGPAAMAATASTSGSSTASIHSASTPNSPGSTISLEGGDGAILRSALQTPRGSHGSHSSIKRRLHILSIDDNQINRKMLAAFLSKMDVEYVEAANGEEGVRAFEAHPPQYFDVILMDISMPVLDGISATAQIRKLEAERFRAAVQHGVAQAPSSWRGSHPRAPGVGTPGGSRPTAQSRAKIFALTGHSSDDDKRRAFATGADGFIVKPLSFKILSSLLKMLAYTD